MSFSSWDVMRQDRAFIAQRARSSLARSVQAASNALYELITAAPPPGSQKNFTFPHDHGRRGGVPISRGMHWCYAGPDMTAWFIYATNVKWVSRNHGSSAFDVDSDFVMDIPWGLDSSTTAISTNPCALEAKVRLYLPAAAGNTKVDAIFVNESIAAPGMAPTSFAAGSYSDTQTASNFSAVNLLTFTAIPIKEDQRNSIRLYLKSDVGAISVDVLTVIVVSTRTTTQPAPLGVVNIEANPKP